MMSCWSLLHIRRFPLKIKGRKRREIYLWSVSAIMTWNLEQRREVDLSNDTKLDLLFARLGAVIKGQTMCFSPKINSKQRDKLDKHSLLAPLKALKTIFMQNMAENVFNRCQRDVCAEEKKKLQKTSWVKFSLLYPALRAF